VGGALVGRRLLPFVKGLFYFGKVGPCKLALVVNDFYRMDKARIATHCSRATILAYEGCLSPLRPHASGRAPLAAWEAQGEPKVVLRAKSTPEMVQLEKSAAKHSVPCVRCLGKDISGDAVTVLAVGPAPSDQVDLVTGHLRLLR